MATAAAVVLCIVLGAGGCSSNDAPDNSAGEESSESTTTTTTPAGLLTATMDILSGQCFNPVPDPTQQPYAVFVVACDDPHEFEAYSTTQLELGEPTPPGTPYPGDLTVANAAEAQCLTGFASFVGLAWESSEYDVQAWWPSAESWTTTNDRSILCGVFRVTAGSDSAMTVGSARNSRR